MQRWQVWLRGALLALWAVGASAGTLDIREGYVRELPPGQTNSAAFMKLVNHGAQPVTIVAAGSSVAARAEIHVTRRHDGLMQMAPVPRVAVPAHGAVALAPGGYHLMLQELKGPFKQGDKVPLTLQFEKAGKVALSLDVEGVGAQAPHDHSGMKK
jgi:copper(I)-binding protein